jgi:hypothetical protein
MSTKYEIVFEASGTVGPGTATNTIDTEGEST